MILFIIVVNLIVSLIILNLIKKGKIKKYCKILRCLNKAQVISVLLSPILFIILMIDLYSEHSIFDNDGRVGGILLLFIYALLGIIVFIFNVVILFLNHFSHKH
jgi:hypothetical protein